MNFKQLILLIFFFISSLTTHAQSNFHMAGGEMRYEFVGIITNTGKIKYKAIFKYYRACNGAQTFDATNEKIYFSVFEKQVDNSFIQVTNATHGIEKLVTANRKNIQKIMFTPSNSCILTPPPFCAVGNNQYVAYELAYYESFFELQSSDYGFRVAFERCCRKENISNIQNTSNGKTGSTYFVDIPGYLSSPGTTSASSNSPYFPSDTAIFICANKNFEYPFEAATNNIDHIRFKYSFTNAYSGFENTIAITNNTSGDLATNPTQFLPIQYKNGFSSTTPMGAAVTINDSTGIISGIAPNEGSYLVAVNASQIVLNANGDEVIIHTQTKDVIINVGNCEKAFNAVIEDPAFPNVTNPIFNRCISNNFTFKNASSASNQEYLWKFGDGAEQLVNTNTSVNHTYLNDGIYNIQLIVKPNTQCSDTAETKVYVFKGFKIDFDYSANCINSNTIFLNKSTTASTGFTERLWRFGTADNATSTMQNPIKDYTETGIYKITLKMQDANGCSDTILKNISIKPITAKANATVYALTGTRVNLGAYGGLQYKWSPANLLDNAFSQSPNALLNSSQDFKVTITTPENCLVEDMQKVIVFNKSNAYIPNAFTPNEDGVNDFFRPILPGFSKLLYFKIFNRYAQEIFRTNDINTRGWDGKYRNTKVPVGSYVWLLQAADKEGKIIEVNGTVILIE
jgi:gliding motility-associated-like protein